MYYNFKKFFEHFVIDVILDWWEDEAGFVSFSILLFHDLAGWPLNKLLNLFGPYFFFFYTDREFWQLLCPLTLKKQQRFYEIYFAYHKIHPFQLYKSVIFSNFTKCCNHHFKSVSEHFYPFNNVPHGHLQLIPTLTPRQLLIHFLSL